MEKIMRLTMKEEYSADIKGLLSENKVLVENIEMELKYSSKSFSINIELLSGKEKEDLLQYFQANKDRALALKLQNYMELEKEPNKTPVKDLMIFKDFLEARIKKLEHKWIFLNEGDILPYFIKDVSYNDGSRHRDYFEEPYILLTLLANTAGFMKNSKNYFFKLGDVKDKTLDEILVNNAIIIENENLIKDYKELEEKFLNERVKYNKQFVTTGEVIFKKSHDVERNSNVHKVVNEEEVSKREYTFQLSTDRWSENGEKEVYDIPCHPYLEVYSLTTHEILYVHVNHLKEYVYDDNLREKLILPDSHKDLLDILTNDLDILSGDIIKGKSTGTTILCKGLPGTGKTLTAEAYSEITHRPLYKINSGQLGIAPAEVEQNLETILRRAERWNAVLLIDEADVYIRERGNDMEQNAVVAAFLRTLEYFHGLLFMTTNRIHDVDDAIASRCIATILYEIPDKENASRIWKVLAEEFKLRLSEQLIDELTSEFPEMSGRDIKELLRLTGRFAAVKNLELTLDAFISCAKFRGIRIH